MTNTNNLPTRMSQDGPQNTPDGTAPKKRVWVKPELILLDGNDGDGKSYIQTAEKTTTYKTAGGSTSTNYFGPS